MCGIVGMAGDVSHLAKNTIFKDMLDVCQVRGRHATGVIKVDDDLDYSYIKNVGPPTYLFDRRSYEDIVEKGNASVLVGHCRHKTSGNNDVASAHPFDYEDEGIIGVHNGTLTGHHKLDGHTFNKVDSDVLYGHLAVNGPEETFNQTFGAWACVWWNDVDKTLNFIRNKERPLWFAWSEDCKTMFWASELWMFGPVSRRITLWKGEKGKGPYVELPENTLWSFHINPKAKKEEKFLRMKAPIKIEPKVEEVRGYQGNHTTTPYRGGNSWKGVNGIYRREKLLEAKKGGEVADPFQKDKLDDDPNAIGLGQGPSITPIGNVSFIQNSLNEKATKVDTKKTEGSTRKILSLQGPSSPTSQLETKDGQSSESEKSSTKTNLSLIKHLSNVSLRTVAGMQYITDNKTGKEISQQEFDEQTKGTCCFCKTPVGDLSEVAEFFSASSFICTTCVQDPADIKLTA